MEVELIHVPHQQPRRRELLRGHSGHCLAAAIPSRSPTQNAGRVFVSPLAAAIYDDVSIGMISPAKKQENKAREID